MTMSKIGKMKAIHNAVDVIQVPGALPGRLRADAGSCDLGGVDDQGVVDAARDGQLPELATPFRRQVTAGEGVVDPAVLVKAVILQGANIQLHAAHEDGRAQLLHRRLQHHGVQIAEDGLVRRRG